MTTCEFSAGVPAAKGYCDLLSFADLAEEDQFTDLHTVVPWMLLSGLERKLRDLMISSRRQLMAYSTTGYIPIYLAATARDAEAFEICAGANPEGCSNQLQPLANAIGRVNLQKNLRMMEVLMALGALPTSVALCRMTLLYY